MNESPYNKKDCWEELNRLTSIVRKLTLSENLEQISKVILEESRAIAQSDGASFVLKDKEFCHYVDENSDFPLWKGQVFPLDKCICGWAMNQGELVSIADISNDERIPMDCYQTKQVRSLLITPILPSNAIGAIGNYWKTEHKPSEDTIHLLQALSNIAAIAIEKNRLHVDLEQLVKERTAQLEHEVIERKKAQDSLMQLSLTDSLTTLLNRRGFFFQVEQELKLASRLHTHSILMFADLDNLKRVNDTYGHAAGDEMISNAAHILRGVFRTSDVISRLGGDEFAAFTMETADPSVIRSRINKAIDNFNSKGDYPYQVSISMGFVALEDTTSVCLEDLLRQADEAMYEDKQAKKKKRRIKIKHLQKIIADNPRY